MPVPVLTMGRDEKEIVKRHRICTMELNGRAFWLMQIYRAGG